MSTGNFKQDVYLQLARVAKAVGHANRLELLEFVAQGPRSVDELAGMTKLSVANASKHLQELRQAGLVKARKEGVRVFYEVAGPDVVDLLGALRVVAESRVAAATYDQIAFEYIAALHAACMGAGFPAIGRAQKLQGCLRRQEGVASVGVIHESQNCIV